MAKRKKEEKTNLEQAENTSIERDLKDGHICPPVSNFESSSSIIIQNTYFTCMLTLFYVIITLDQTMLIPILNPNEYSQKQVPFALNTHFPQEQYDRL